MRPSVSHHRPRHVNARIQDISMNKQNTSLLLTVLLLCSKINRLTFMVANKVIICTNIGCRFDEKHQMRQPLIFNAPNCKIAFCSSFY